MKLTYQIRPDTIAANQHEISGLFRNARIASETLARKIEHIRWLMRDNLGTVDLIDFRAQAGAIPDYAAALIKEITAADAEARRYESSGPDVTPYNVTV